MSESDCAPCRSAKRRVRHIPNAGSAQSRSDIGNYWGLLPIEMVDQILDVVVSSSPQDGYNARAVCHQWKDTLQSKLPFGGIFNDQTIHTVSKLDPKIPLKTLILTRLNLNAVRAGFMDGDEHTVKNRYGGETFNAMLFRRSVEHLIIGGDAGALLKSHGDEEELPFSLSTGFAEDHKVLKEVNRSIHGLDLENILPQLKDVKTLTLSSIAFYSVSDHMMRQLDFSEQFSTITKLDICIGSKTDIDKILLFFEKAECPSLLSLYIRAYSYCFHLILYISYYRFIAKHPSLKNLSISQTQSFYQVPLSDVDKPNLMVASYPDIAEKLMNIQLECLRIDGVIGGCPIVSQWKLLEEGFIKNQTALRSLELQICFRTLRCRVDELLPRCEETLERLEISSLNNIPNQFDCQGISNFKKLAQCNVFMKRPSPQVLCLHHQELSDSSLIRINMLPRCITSLHLGELPNIRDIRALKYRLVNLKRVSYIGPDSDGEMSSSQFLRILVEHLQFQNLTEFKIYRYSCPLSVFSYLNAQKGIICYPEEADSMAIFVERNEFEVENMLNSDVTWCDVNRSHSDMHEM